MEALKAWLRQPFKPNGTTLDWFLFLGLVIVLMAAWKIIIIHITEEI